MPPSAMTGTPAAATPSIANWIAEICGTPTPATMRVVQIEPGPMPTLTASAPWSDQRLRAGGGRDVAADDLHIGIALLDGRDAFQHALRMPVRGIDHDHVHPCGDQGLDPLVGIAGRPDRRADPQPAEVVLARVRMLDALQDVLDRDEAAQLHLAVDDQHALEAMPMHEPLGHFDLGAFRHGHQAVALGHDVGDRLVEVGLEPEVAIGDDADHATAFDHRKSGDAVLVRQRQHLAHRHRRRDRDRILHHAAFEALDLGDFSRLLGRRHVLVYDTKATLLRDGDREATFGDRIHGRRDQRNVEGDAAGQAGFQRYVARNDAGMCGDEEDVVESQRFADDTH